MQRKEHSCESSKTNKQKKTHSLICVMQWKEDSCEISCDIYPSANPSFIKSQLCDLGMLLSFSELQYSDLENGYLRGLFLRVEQSKHTI